MARAFHLSCMGPLDRASVEKASLVMALAGFARDPSDIEKVLAANPGRPARLNIAGSSLRSARALDAVLLKHGILSQIFWADTEHPEVVQVFVNQREAQRRDREQLSVAKRVEVQAPVARRKARGRRKDDS